MESSQHRQQPKTPRLRTRQGCWSCRRRRRKCDEGKPSCQSCIKKGVRCKYGIQLTFHDANLFELDPREVRELRAHAPERYQSLQFVDGMKEDEAELSESQSNQNQRASVTPNTSGEQRDLGLQTPGNFLAVTRRDFIHREEPNLQQDSNDDSLDYQSNVGSDLPVHHEQSIGEKEMNFSATTLLSNPNEQTWRGLNQSQHESPSPSHGRDIESSNSDPNPSCLPLSNGDNRLIPIVRRLEDVASSSRSHLHQLCLDSTTEVHHDLLKYYIDNIAPWLELCSLDALFSIYIPLISSSYQPLRQAIFALAASQRQMEGDTALAVSFLEASLKSLGSDMNSRHEEPIVTKHLHLIAQLVSHPVRDWRPILIDRISGLDELGMHGFLDDIRGTAAWLTIRFDLANSLLSQLPLASNLKHWRQAESPSASSSRISPESANLRKAMLMCIEVVSYWQSVDKRIDVERWVLLSSMLPTLEKSQSLELTLPLLSSPIGKIVFSRSDNVSPSRLIPASFPISIFTSRSGFYTAFLKHLMQMLLVQCKPRRISTRAAKLVNTAAWHAVQVCGLSLSNSILWSWDPLVVAALLLAGSFVSYSEQQQELMEHLIFLKRMTGWGFDLEIQNLETLWNTAC